jgi:pimeloyl-ACP methyl ester carboxylesterase
MDPPMTVPTIGGLAARSAATATLMLACLAAPGTTGAAPCSLGPAVLQRGDTRDVLLRGSGVADIGLDEGMADGGLEELDRQPLRLCRVGDREPGLHLVLRAGPGAARAPLPPRRADGTPACDAPVVLEVPERLRLGSARLRARLAAGELAARSLVLWGADDPQVPLALGLRLQGQLRLVPAVAETHVLDDAGHFPFVEQPGAFERAVTSFCGDAVAAR